VQTLFLNTHFPFLSFPFLSFPFLSFPFLSFPFHLRQQIDSMPLSEILDWDHGPLFTISMSTSVSDATSATWHAWRDGQFDML
jgi:hypothetical protein